VTDEALRPDQIIATVQYPMILVTMGIDAAKEERWSDGAILLAAAYERLTKRAALWSSPTLTPSGMAIPKNVVPGSALAYYGLCLALDRGNYVEGAKFVNIAIHNEPVVGEHYVVLAKLWKHARSRRKMAEAIEKGLAASPRYGPLRRLANEVGVRRRKILPFLPRGNALNKALGKLRHRMVETRRQRKKKEPAERAPDPNLLSPLQSAPGSRPGSGDKTARRTSHRPSKN
jgi:hypothetical protein